MGDFLERHGEIAQDALDEREPPPTQEDHCPECDRLLHAGKIQDNADAALYRCQDCPFGPIMCRLCVLKDHRSRPFDRIRRWSVEDQCWVKTTLPQLGYVMFVGHGHKCCPMYARREDESPMYEAHAREMVVLHEHGIMNVNMVLCICEGAPSNAQQLLAGGLWPATWDQPKTATTLAALELFDSLNHQAQVNVHDFLGCLNRMTDAVLTDEVQVSKRQTQELQWRADVE